MTKVIFSKNQVKDLHIDELFEEAIKVVDLILPESNLQYIQDLIYRIRPSQISTCNSASIKEKELELNNQKYLMIRLLYQILILLRHQKEFLQMQASYH